MIGLHGGVKKLNDTEYYPKFYSRQAGLPSLFSHILLYRTLMHEDRNAFHAARLQYDQFRSFCKAKAKLMHGIAP